MFKLKVTLAAVNECKMFPDKGSANTLHASHQSARHPVCLS